MVFPFQTILKKTIIFENNTKNYYLLTPKTHTNNVQYFLKSKLKKELCTTLHCSFFFSQGSK